MSPRVGQKIILVICSSIFWTLIFIYAMLSLYTYYGGLSDLTFNLSLFSNSMFYLSGSVLWRITFLFSTFLSHLSSRALSHFLGFTSLMIGLAIGAVVGIFTALKYQNKNDD